MPHPEILTDVALKICEKYGFQLIQMVGQGAYKETFKVIANNGTSLALKLYRPQSVDKRTAREVDIMQRCSHERIAKLHFVDTYTINSTTYVFLVEEFLAGGTLSQRLAQNRILDRQEVIELGYRLIEGIAYLQHLDLVHRDIKPQNILYRDTNNTPVLTDFGIARDLRAEAITAMSLSQGPGTPGFMAPEQLNNALNLIDWRTDQFACGITLSLCACGKHPYGQSSESLGNIVERMVNYRDTNSEFREAIAAARLPAIGKMVEAWPINRFRTVDALLKGWSAQGE